MKAGAVPLERYPQILEVVRAALSSSHDVQALRAAVAVHAAPLFSGPCALLLPGEPVPGQGWHTAPLNPPDLGGLWLRPGPGGAHAGDLATLALLAVHLGPVVEQAQRHRALERQALSDPLTGLGNRRAFTAAVQRVLDTPGRHGAALAVLDIRGFKAINDACGHDAGDQVLVEVAQTVQSLLDDRGQVYRLGGDEFAALIPEGASNTLETLLGGLSEPGSVVMGRVVVDCGHCAPTDTDDPASWLRRADLTMYRHKHAHRPLPQPDGWSHGQTYPGAD